MQFIRETIGSPTNGHNVASKVNEVSLLDGREIRIIQPKSPFRVLQNDANNSSETARDTDVCKETIMSSENIHLGSQFQPIDRNEDDDDDDDVAS